MSRRGDDVAGRLTPSLVALVLMVMTGGAQQRAPSAGPIDRRALVSRHNPRLTAVDPLSPLTVGNGEFAFTADITGLQTFPELYERVKGSEAAGGRTPLVSQAQWGWHSFPNRQGFRPEDAFAPYDAHGRTVQYASNQRSAAGTWLRENPHRINLARIGLALRVRDGRPAVPSDVQTANQSLDLWSGTLTSEFTVEGRRVRVQTWVHPERDVLAVRVDAADLPRSQIALRIAFPYARALHSDDPSEWSSPERHDTELVASGRAEAHWRRRLDGDGYEVRARWSNGGSLEGRKPHEFVIPFAEGSGAFEAAIGFSAAGDERPLPDVAVTAKASASHWDAFWRFGGAIDLSGSTHPQAGELERRIVQSQYLMAIQSAGSMPPQETGLTYNSWFGKFHLEMHWWHGTHFALWNRIAMLERSLPWYERILPAARAEAARQGYAGARWPKMVGPEGRDSPSGIGVFLIWQQPHPIYFAELAYRQRPARATLERYRQIVFDSADFMASYAVWQPARRQYVLGPPLIPAQESHPPRTTFNPGFELAYWRFGLETAQQWRERLGMSRDAKWDDVLNQLAPLPARDGLYVNAESAPATFSDAEERRDHPTLLAPCGMLPCTGVDREMMRRTLAEVMRTWNFGHTWGWDYPLIAMTAARVGEPQMAIDALLMDTQKNRYLPNGHNYQDARLTLYLPGNGALLAAAAMMAAGWDGAPDVPAPGFPKDGRWVVRAEGLHRLP